jgi:UDP-N-acetylglucosamine 2-epimerase (non-hydrolysing)
LQEKKIYEKLENCKNLLMIPPVGYIDFICLVKNASKIVTDSGGLQKEAYLLSIPCITIRQNTEWKETVDEGWNVLTDTNSAKIISAVREWIPIDKSHRKIFGNGNTSTIIKDIILQEIVK